MGLHTHLTLVRLLLLYADRGRCRAGLGIAGEAGEGGSGGGWGWEGGAGEARAEVGRRGAALSVRNPGERGGAGREWAGREWAGRGLGPRVGCGGECAGREWGPRAGREWGPRAGAPGPGCRAWQGPLGGGGRGSSPGFALDLKQGGHQPSGVLENISPERVHSVPHNYTAGKRKKS